MDCGVRCIMINTFYVHFYVDSIFSVRLFVYAYSCYLCKYSNVLVGLV